MLVTYILPLSIGFLLMLFVMAMVSIEDVSYLADLVLEMESVNLRIMQLRVFPTGQSGVPAARDNTYLEACHVFSAWRLRVADVVDNAGVSGMLLTTDIWSLVRDLPRPI